MAPVIDWEYVLGRRLGFPRYEQIAAVFEAEIAAGRLGSGSRLPAVRQLSRELGVSSATVAAAYELLNRRGWTRGEVGRGTFVRGTTDDGHTRGRASRVAQFGASQTDDVRSRPAPPRLWRQRALAASAARLRKAFERAVDCTTGRPDPALLPLAALRRALSRAIEVAEPEDLQYAGPEPVEALASQLLLRLARDGVRAQAQDLVIGSSALELLVLALDAHIGAGRRHLVAVEEPGYSRAFDAIERAGHRLVGIELDDTGAVPGSLQAALEAGAMAVLLTPRAHNPTGVSWDAQRRAALADVLAASPDVLAIEDDHFAELAIARPGSLFADPRLAERVVYIRSFGKSIAPDLRLAVAVARPRLRAGIAEAESLTSGWSSRLTQRALASVLADPELDAALDVARRAYADRRSLVRQAITTALVPAGASAAGDDGLNIWVQLPFGADAVEVLERAADLGVLAAPGEPYFIRPGRADVLRLTTAALDTGRAAELGAALGRAAANAVRAGTATVCV